VIGAGGVSKQVSLGGGMIAMDEVNRVIAGRYQILSKLGEGGFGSTWLARHELVGQQVVIKIMHHGAEERFRGFFREEAKVLARINNPHVGRILDFGELEDGLPYLVLEYVEGESLERRLRHAGPLAVVPALTIAEAVADALSAAHAIGVIHRDLKPSNIILPRTGFDGAKLLDFGVRGQLRNSTGTTQAGEFYGTPQYMSPEQLRANEQSPATDVFGLGVVLYEMLYGETPFTGEGFLEIASKTLREEVAFPSFPIVPDGVRDLIRRCLSKQAKDRAQNGSALLAEIRRVRAALPPSPSVTSSYAVEFDLPKVSASKSPPSPQPRWETTTLASARPSPHRKAKLRLGPFLIAPLILIGLLICVLSIVGIALFFFYGVWDGSVSSPVWRRLAWILIGLVLSAAGIGMWFWTRKWLGARRSEIQRDADSIMLGRKSLDALTQSLAIEIDTIITRVKQVDDMIIAHTLAMMVREYESAKESKDRQSALVNAVSLLEKLTTRLSPWYVRHDKFVAFVVSSVGVVSGLVTVVMSVIKIKKGTP
jgi:serine/threonine protein kinase